MIATECVRLDDFEAQRSIRAAEGEFVRGGTAGASGAPFRYYRRSPHTSSKLLCWYVVKFRIRIMAATCVPCPGTARGLRNSAFRK